MTELFVTGTDTGIGKTTVGCALLSAARGRGQRAVGMKPIETGCERDPHGRLVPADALALARHGQTPPAIVYRFAAPLAPSVAAEREGARIDLAPILAAVDRLRSLAPDLFLIEGAGGLLVPIADRLDMAGLAARLAVPILIVARDSLGTINHTLLTIEAARSRGLEIAGVVLNAAAPGTSDREADRNAEEIARRGRVRVLGRFPYLVDTSSANLARAAEDSLDLEPLLQLS